MANCERYDPLRKRCQQCNKVSISNYEPRPQDLTNGVASQRVMRLSAAVQPPCGVRTTSNRRFSSRIGLSTNGVGGLDLALATFGPRHTWSPARPHTQLFGETLGGVAWGFNSMSPAPSGVVGSASTSALELGGGVSLPLSAHLAVRAFQADLVAHGLPERDNERAEQSRA